MYFQIKKVSLLFACQVTVLLHLVGAVPSWQQTLAAPLTVKSRSSFTFSLSQCYCSTGHRMIFRAFLQKHALVSFSKTSNGTRPGLVQF